MRTRSQAGASRGGGRAGSPATARGRQGQELSPQDVTRRISAAGAAQMSPSTRRAALGSAKRRQSTSTEAKINGLADKLAGLTEQVGKMAAAMQQMLAAPRHPRGPTVAPESSSFASPSRSPLVASLDGTHPYSSSPGQQRRLSGADTGFVGAAATWPQVSPRVLRPVVSDDYVLNRTVGAPESQGVIGGIAAGLSTEPDPSAAAFTDPPAGGPPAAPTRGGFVHGAPAPARAPPAVAPAPGVHAAAAATARAASPPAAGPPVVPAARDDSEFLRKFIEDGRKLWGFVAERNRLPVDLLNAYLADVGRLVSEAGTTPKSQRAYEKSDIFAQSFAHWLQSHGLDAAPAWQVGMLLAGRGTIAGLQTLCAPKQSKHGSASKPGLTALAGALEDVLSVTYTGRTIDAPGTNFAMRATRVIDGLGHLAGLDMAASVRRGMDEIRTILIAGADPSTTQRLVEEYLAGVIEHWNRHRLEWLTGQVPEAVYVPSKCDSARDDMPASWATAAGRLAEDYRVARTANRLMAPLRDRLHAAEAALAGLSAKGRKPAAASPATGREAKAPTADLQSRARAEMDSKRESIMAAPQLKATFDEGVPRAVQDAGGCSQFCLPGVARWNGACRVSKAAQEAYCRHTRRCESQGVAWEECDEGFHKLLSK